MIHSVSEPESTQPETRSTSTAPNTETTDAPTTATTTTTNAAGQRTRPSRRNAWGNTSYAEIITQAIMSSAEQRLTLSQIYDWMINHIQHFKDKSDRISSAGWKNSIRHNLSLHERFLRIHNEGTGKSSWWIINPNGKNKKQPRKKTKSNEEECKPAKRAKISPAPNSATPNDNSAVAQYPNAYYDFQYQQQQQQQMYLAQQQQQFIYPGQMALYNQDGTIGGYTANPQYPQYQQDPSFGLMNSFNSIGQSYSDPSQYWTASNTPRTFYEQAVPNTLPIAYDQYYDPRAVGMPPVPPSTDPTHFLASGTSSEDRNQPVAATEGASESEALAGKPEGEGGVSYDKEPAVNYLFPDPSFDQSTSTSNEPIEQFISTGLPPNGEAEQPTVGSGPCGFNMISHDNGSSFAYGGGQVYNHFLNQHKAVPNAQIPNGANLAPLFGYDLLPEDDSFMIPPCFPYSRESLSALDELFCGTPMHNIIPNGGNGQEFTPPTGEDTGRNGFPDQHSDTGTQ